MTNWRLIEDALIHSGRKAGYDVGEDSQGDKIIIFACNDDANAYHFNLTKLAIDLAECFEIRDRVVARS